MQKRSLEMWNKPYASLITCICNKEAFFIGVCGGTGLVALKESLDYPSHQPGLLLTLTCHRSRITWAYSFQPFFLNRQLYCISCNEWMNELTFFQRLLLTIRIIPKCFLLINPGSANNFGKELICSTKCKKFAIYFQKRIRTIRSHTTHLWKPRLIDTQMLTSITQLLKHSTCIYGRIATFQNNFQQKYLNFSLASSQTIVLNLLA